MAEYICPICGADVYWTPLAGKFQTSGWLALCDECKEKADAAD